MKVLVVLIALTGSALSQSFDYDGRYVEDNSGAYYADDSGSNDGRYVEDNSGAYYADDSGRYIHDRSGEYFHDNSGDYIHQPGPDGPDYVGEATNVGVTFLSPNIIPSENRQYLPPTTGFRPPSTPAPPLEPPPVVNIRPPARVPVRPPVAVPVRPPARLPPSIPVRPSPPVAKRPPPTITRPIRPRPARPDLVIPTPPPAKIASTSRRPSIQGGGPYIWHYESQPHTVDVIDPFHKYRVHFPH
ncbi:hypothetical protein QE152_g10607 [Popillia japonica]|uniref:Uncharacterized protein n=1 Tax=Popillia japonica TaxID=7064 RepID=A0AAW1LUL6_POPJA